MEKFIYIDLGDWDNIVKAELQKRKLENNGYSYKKTTSMGFEKYKLEYAKH